MMIDNPHFSRGKYVRECDTAMKNKQYFAKKADEERELRLRLRDPINWLSEFFSKEPDKEDLQKFAGALVGHLERAGYDTSELDDLFQRIFVD